MNATASAMAELANTTSEPVTTLMAEEAPERVLHLDLYYYKLSADLFIAIDPIITFGGLLGNILIMMVMQRQALRPTSFSLYMTALAVSDTLVLVLDFINNWFKMELDLYLLGMSDGFCKFHRFFFNVCYTMSAWFVVAATLEKFIVVWFPFKAKIFCNRRTAGIVVAVIPLPCIALYFYNLFAWGVNDEGNCDMTPNLADFQTNIGPWLSGTAYSYLPLLILIVANSAIIYKLWQSRKQRQAMAGPGKSEADEKAERRITKTVVIICLFYVLLTTPLALFYFILFTAEEFINPGPTLALAEVIILIFGLSNHAINCILLSISSVKFRYELILMLTFWKKSSRSGKVAKGKGNKKFNGSSSQGTSGEGTASTLVNTESISKGQETA